LPVVQCGLQRQSAPVDDTLDGAYGTGTLTLASLNGFSGTVALTCNPPLPINYLCTLSPTTASLSANGVASSTIKLHPNLRSSITPPSSSRAPRILFGAIFPLALFAFFRRKRRRLTPLLSLALMSLISLSLTACGPDLFFAATPPGTYPITVTATGSAPGSTTPITHTLPLDIVITP
jgi:hypothetical protein